MTKPSDLAALRRIADLRHQMVAQRMAALTRQETDIAGHLDGLSAARQARASDLVGAQDDAALQAGQDLLWQSWVDRRRSTLTGDLARLSVQKDRLRADLARQFGRSEAIASLHRALSESLRRDRDRRADQ